MHVCYVNRSQKITEDNSEIIFENVKKHKHEIEHFACENLQYKFMPQKLNETIGSDLKGIEIIYSNLEVIRRKDLKSFGNLIYLNLKGNLIKCIDKDTFSCNSKLKFISLNYNRIRRINPLAFMHLKVLQQLWLRHNFCYFGDANTIYEIPLSIKKIGEDCMPIFKTLNDDLFKFKCSSLDVAEIEGGEVGEKVTVTEERLRYKTVRDEEIKKALMAMMNDKTAKDDIEGLCWDDDDKS